MDIEVIFAMNDVIQHALITRVTDSRALALGVASPENTGNSATKCVIRIVVEELVSKNQVRASGAVKKAFMA